MAEGNMKFAGANELKVGSYVLIDGEPCQIKGIEKSKPGKHGAAKIRATAMGLFKDTKKTLMKPSDAEVEVPIIDKGTAQVVAVMGTTIQIMDVSTYETFDLDKPKDIQGLSSGSEVEFIKWGPMLKITRKKGSA